MRAPWVPLVVFVWLLAPAVAFAQASITGVVKDTSGAVLPGVTVDASSPALIEKARTVITDGTGQYRIVDLRPGTYSVTFMLPGFNTVRRDGIELTGSIIGTINAELSVGALVETITVDGGAGVVLDVQSVRRQTTVAGDVIASLPTSRSYGSLFQLVPAVTGGSRDVQTLPALVVFGGPGGRATEGRLQVDGLGVGAPLSGGGVSGYIPDIGNAQEVSFTTSGGLGEAEVGGPTMNIVPKTGGNTLKGTLYAAGVNSGMVGSNYTSELKAAGLRTPGQLLKLWDINGGVGGPIVRDRLWYFAGSREEGSWQSVPGMYRNQNAGDPTKFVYVPDRSRQAVTAGDWATVNLRLTMQPTARNRVNVFWDEQRPCQGAAWPGTNDGCRQQPDTDWIIGGAPGSAGTFGLATATQSPEFSNYAGRSHARQRAQQATWTSPFTNRLLLDAGFGTNYSHYGGQEMPGNPTRGIPKMIEQCATPPANAVPGACDHGIQNLTFGSQDWTSNQGFVITWRASSSYVTGAHSMKFGYQAAYHRVNQSYFSNDTHLTYTLNNGVPNRLTMDLKPFRTGQRTRWEAVYAQEQWTLGRMTLQGALRFDHAWSYFPDQQIGPVRFLPTPLVFEAQSGVKGYNDITPRGGVAFDLFGNGRTALKVNAGKYLEAATNHNTYSLSNPAARIAGSPVLGAPPAVSRPWTDSNGNYVPDCDLLNPLAQNLAASGGDICGILTNVNFGKPVFTGSFDPDILEGWGVRPSDWQVGVSVQQQIVPKVAVEVGYFRRWLQNFTVVDNLAVVASDFDTFGVTAPSDPRLPGGGGNVVPGLYNVSDAKTGQTNSFTTWARNFGDQTSMYNGVLVNLTARAKNFTVQGGVNTGRTVVDSCALRTQLPETNPTNPYCRDDPGFMTRVTGLAAYTVPKLDVLLSGTFRSDQGTPLAANWVVSSAEAAKSLGRPLSGGAPNVTVNLIEPGTLWSDRVNVFDLRVAKILRFGRTRSTVGIDIYNLTNSSAVLTYNQSYSPTGNWLVPTTVVTPRFAKISASFDF